MEKLRWIAWCEKIGHGTALNVIVDSMDFEDRMLEWHDVLVDIKCKSHDLLTEKSYYRRNQMSKLKDIDLARQKMHKELMRRNLCAGAGQIQFQMRHGTENWSPSISNSARSPGKCLEFCHRQIAPQKAQPAVRRGD